MKKLMLLLSMVVVLLACSKKDEPQATRQVTFQVPQFQQTQEPINAPRRAPIYDESEDGYALTDLYIFDGTTQLAHQTSDDENFGTVTLDLSYGSHNLSFVCTRSTGITYNDGVLSFSSVRSTFGKLLPLTVNSSTGNQSVEVDRLNGKLSIVIEDAFPSNAASIEFVISPRPTSINVQTLVAADTDTKTYKIGCTQYQGQTGASYSFIVLPRSLTEEEFVDVTINVYTATDVLIRSITVEDIRLAANTKTNLTGSVFTGTGAMISVNTTWNDDIDGSF